MPRSPERFPIPPPEGGIIRNKVAAMKWAPRVRQLIALLMVAAITLMISPARAGNTVGAIVQNAATANGSGLVVTVYGTFLVATYSISGTFNATVNFEGTGADGTYQSLGCIPITGGSAVSTTTTTGAWRCNIVNLLQIRARVSGYVSGSVTVSLQASDFGNVLVGPPVDSASAGLQVVPVASDPVGPATGALWLSTTTPKTLKYFEGTATRSLVDLSLSQTLSNKTFSNPVFTGSLTLVSPTISGIISGTPTWATPIGAESGGTGLNTRDSSGTPHLSLGTWKIGDLRAEAYPFVSSLLSGVPGRLVYQSGGQKSLQLDAGLQWLQLDDLSSPNTLTNKTLVAPILSGTTTGVYTLGGTPTLTGTVSGTYTLAGTPTVASPVFTGTVTGIYVLGGTPTISSPILEGTVSGTPTWASGQRFPFLATTTTQPFALTGDLVLGVLLAAGPIVAPGFGALTLRARRSQMIAGACALWAIGGAVATETLIKDGIAC